MDGVLVDSMNYHMQSWKQLLEKYGISITERFVYEHEGAMGLDIIENLFHKTGLRIDSNQILEATLQLCKVKPLRINVIGIGVDLSFLRKLARDTGGQSKFFK